MLHEIRQERRLGKVFVEENLQLTKLNNIFSELSKKYNLDYDNLIDLINRRKNFITVPVTLFANKLSPLENIVMYLHVIHNFSQTQISSILKRDHTTIWTTLSNALNKIKKEKYIESVNNLEKSVFIPLEELSNRKLSILESVAVFLKSKYRYSEIAELLGKDQRTIWTVVNRAKKKNAK